jgi:hypothetical protein
MTSNIMVKWTATGAMRSAGCALFLPCLGVPMKRLVQIPAELVDLLKRDAETGIGYQVVSVKLKDGRLFDQVSASEGCIIEVRGIRKFLLSLMT